MRANRALLSVCAMAALIAAAGSPSVASTFLKTDIKGLQRMSESVVHAKVVDINSYWNADHSMIFTDVALEVKGTLHGAAERQIVVRVPGGTVGDFTAEMIGAPEFEMDEDVVVFIARWDDGVPMVAGYFQGKARVLPDRANNLILHGGVADGLPISELAKQLGRSAR